MTLRRAITGLLALARKRSLERELENEVLAHLELAERDAMVRGLSVEDARRRFGGIEQMKEEHRDQRSHRWIETLLRDFRYGLASLRRDPGFTAVAIGVLALGIGANTAMFSLVDAALLKPLPFPEPERIVRVFEAPTPTTRNETTTLTFLDWKKQEAVFEALSVEFPTRAALVTDGEPARVSGMLVSTAYFRVFGVNAQIGRTFAPGEDQPGAAPVVVISHGFRLTRFGGDPNILHRELVLDGERHKVIGVLPPGSFDRDEAAFWKPLVFDADQLNRGAHWLPVVGRLRAGVSLEQARARMLALRASLADVMPAWKKAWSFAVDPFAKQLVGDTLRRSIYLAFGAVLMVLLITCANVANLLLAKGATRRKEIAVRTALGASRGRLIRQLLAESLMLCLLGGAAGVAFAWFLIHAADPLLARSLPFTAEVRLDLRVLAFAVTVAMAVTLLVGLLPSLRNSSGNLTRSLNHAARGSSGSSTVLRRIIVTGEVAISLVLVCGALLLFKSLVNLHRVDVGVRVANVVNMSVDLPLAAYPEPENAAQFYRDVVQRLEAAPGVERASVSQDLPLEGVRGGELIALPGFSEPLIVRFKRVDPGYLDTLDIPLETGRGITSQDRAGAPRVMVINKELARRLSAEFGMSNPVGQAVRISCPGYGKKNGMMPPVQIVGVIRNERTKDLHSPDEMVVYAPLAQVPRQDINLVVRTHGDLFAAISGIREAVRQIDPNLPLADIRTMEQVKQRNLSWATRPAWVIGAFAAIAALLAALGLYGVLAQTVTQQRREIGIRMALGADSRDVLSQVLRNALAMVVVGLAIGLAGAFALTSVMQSLLFQVSALDPIAFVIACGSMTLIGLLAGLLPARRATRVDPVTVLRDEG